MVNIILRSTHLAPGIYKDALDLDVAVINYKGKNYIMFWSDLPAFPGDIVFEQVSISKINNAYSAPCIVEADIPIYHGC